MIPNHCNDPAFGLVRSAQWRTLPVLQWYVPHCHLEQLDLGSWEKILLPILAFAVASVASVHRTVVTNCPTFPIRLLQCTQMWHAWILKCNETLNMFWYALTVFRASFKCSCFASPLVCPQTSAICQLSPDICIFETKQIELRQVRSAIFVEFVHCIDCMCGCVIGSEKMLIRWITH